MLRGKREVSVGKDCGTAPGGWLQSRSSSLEPSFQPVHCFCDAAWEGNGQAAGCREVLAGQAPAGGGLLCITRCRWGNGLDPVAGGSGAQLPGLFSAVQRC